MQAGARVCHTNVAVQLAAKLAERGQQVLERQRVRGPRRIVIGRVVHFGLLKIYVQWPAIDHQFNLSGRIGRAHTAAYPKQDVGLRNQRMTIAD